MPRVEPFFTIGHATRPLPAFMELLRESRVDLVIDVRSMPRSRTNPQFNGDILPEALAPWQVGYQHIAALGGLRSKLRAAEPALNAGWRVRSFHNYADYALTAAFATGLDELRQAGRRRRCAIMCAETVWWRCHRRIIADYLIAAGETVLHILARSKVEPAQLTPWAVVRDDRRVVSPATGEAGAAALMSATASTSAS